MKKIMASISVVLCAFLTSQAATLDQQADSAYSADDFALAASIYRQIMQNEGTSPQLYYNLANCEYRLGNLGKAIVNYERALRMDPTFDDAKTNLEFVNSRIVDRQGERGSFLSNTYDRFALAATPDTWAWTSFVLFTLAAVAIATYFFSSNISIRKTGFFGAITLLILFGITLIIASRAKNITTDRDTAIITVQSTILSTSPREPKDRNEEAMLLHEGTKVTILDSISVPGDTTGMRWLDVQIDNIHRAWIKSTDIERI